MRQIVEEELDAARTTITTRAETRKASKLWVLLSFVLFVGVAIVAYAARPTVKLETARSIQLSPRVAVSVILPPSISATVAPTIAPSVSATTTATTTATTAKLTPSAPVSVPTPHIPTTAAPVRSGGPINE